MGQNDDNMINAHITYKTLLYFIIKIKRDAHTKFCVAGMSSGKKGASNNLIEKLFVKKKEDDEPNFDF